MRSRSHLYQPGHSGNPNGCPPGRHRKGRPSNYLKAKCQKLLDHPAVFKFLRDVVTGNKKADFTISISGEIVPIPPRARLRLDAIHDLMDRGYGLPTQSVELSGLDDIHEDIESRYDTDSGSDSGGTIKERFKP